MGGIPGAVPLGEGYKQGGNLPWLPAVRALNKGTEIAGLKEKRVPRH